MQRGFIAGGAVDVIVNEVVQRDRFAVGGGREFQQRTLRELDDERVGVPIVEAGNGTTERAERGVRDRRRFDPTGRRPVPRENAACSSALEKLDAGIDGVPGCSRARPWPRADL